MKNKTVEQEMASILKDEISSLDLKNTDDLVNALLEVEKESASLADRRNPQKLLNQIIDQTLKEELGEE